MSVVLVTRDVKKECSWRATKENGRRTAGSRRKVLIIYRLVIQPACAKQAGTPEGPPALTDWLVKPAKRLIVVNPEAHEM